MKEVHDFDEWKWDLHQAIVLDCNERWSWDFTSVPMVPECLFWPAEQPPCPDLGFWFRGHQHSEPHKVPDLGSMLDPWDVPLSMAMPHDVLWSYLAFRVISVSSSQLLYLFVSLVVCKCCLQLFCLAQGLLYQFSLSILQLWHCMSCLSK